MSYHNATTPNISHDAKQKIQEILLSELKGRDFVLVVLEHPNSFIATNQDTPAQAKKIVTESLAKPWA